MGKEMVFIDCIWIGLLCMISYADWKEKRIPDKLLLGVAVCAVVQMFFLGKEEIMLRVAGMGSSVFVFFLILIAAPVPLGEGM